MTTTGPVQLALFPGLRAASDTGALSSVVGGRLDVAAELLAEIGQRRYVVLRDTEHVMRVVEPGRVRHALDVDELICGLLAHSYARVAWGADAETVMHGNITRLVVPILLTPTGAVAAHRLHEQIHHTEHKKN